MHRSLFPVLALLAVPALAEDTWERFFTEDFFPLIYTRLDPIISPGQVSSHVHHVVGSSKFTADESFASAQTAECTTSFIQDDKSNFWAPQLYYKWKNGTYSAVRGDGMSAYWKFPDSNPTDDPPFRVVPDDFRVVAGNISRDHYDPTQALDNAVSFQCVDTTGKNDKFWYIPAEMECTTLRPQINFPECWDGVNAYLEDGSHVSYPTDGQPEGGTCPEGYYKIPHLFLESTYHPSVENIGEGYEWYPGCFVLANGDNHGLSYHSDWLNGWPTGMVVDAYRNCHDTLDGGADHCPLLADSITSDGADRGCVTVGDVVNELAGQNQPLLALPGNNPEYNSSRYSDNYPKAPAADYVEQSQVVQVSNDTQGYCTAGDCVDYAGSAAAAATAVVASNATSSASPTSIQNETETASIASNSATSASSTSIQAETDSIVSFSAFATAVDATSSSAATTGTSTASASATSEATSLQADSASYSSSSVSSLSVAGTATAAGRVRAKRRVEDW